MDVSPTIIQGLMVRFYRKNWPHSFPPGEPVSDKELNNLRIYFYEDGHELMGEKVWLFCVELLHEAFQKGWDACAAAWEFEEGVDRHFEGTRISTYAQDRLNEYLQNLPDL